MNDKTQSIDLWKGMSLIIKGAIKITILGKKGDEIKIGIEAPRHVKIRRAELLPLDKK
jgi:carbon storage regulator CsrA